MLHTNFNMMHEVALKYGMTLLSHSIQADDLGSLRAGSFSFQYAEKTPKGLHKYANSVGIVLTIHRTNNPGSPTIMVMTADGLVPSNVDKAQKETFSVEINIHFDGINFSTRKLIESGELNTDSLCKEIFNLIGPFARVPKALDAMWTMFNDNPGLVDRGGKFRETGGLNE